jgi:hypothetical protein
VDWSRQDYPRKGKTMHILLDCIWRRQANHLASGIEMAGKMKNEPEACTISAMVAVHDQFNHP